MLVEKFFIQDEVGNYLSSTYNKTGIVYAISFDTYSEAETFLKNRKAPSIKGQIEYGQITKLFVNIST